MKPSTIQLTIATFVLRIGFGSMMLFGHGLGKLRMLIEGNIQFPELFGLSPMVNLILATTAEFLASIFIILGFKTRWASIPLIVTMAVAAFKIHWDDAFFAMNANGGASKEFAMIYLIGFLSIGFLGSGNFSIDTLFKKK